MELTAAQVASLAPDASSLAAGRKLAAAKHWKSTGRDSAAMWGECQGSALYQVKVDLGTFAYNCSCPSRKLPCKHVLGLLLLAAEGAPIATATMPEWVTSWLDKRADTAKKKEEKQQATEAKPVDAVAQAKRAAKREANVGDGIEQVDLWMADLIRGGLAGLERKPPSFWQDQAKRLVDAQAKGLAVRVERLGELAGSGSDWPAKLLGELGKLALLTEAYQRLPQLDGAIAADLRQLVGWTVDEQALKATGDLLRDRWLVLGQSVEEEARIRVERNWLLGLSTGRTALVLQFSFGKQPFPTAIVPASVIEGELAFYASAHPQRAQLVNCSHTEPQFAGRLAGVAITQMLSEAADAIARQPWLEQTVVVLAEARLAVAEESAWQICDAAGDSVPLARSPQWSLLALAGGVATSIAGLWNGAAFEPLGLVADGQYKPLIRQI